MDVKVLFKTLEFAAIQHQYQRRSGYRKLPYINHLIKVTSVLMEVAEVKDQNTLIAAILHDAVEDTDLTAHDIEIQFGFEVARIVYELSDNMALSYVERKEKQLETAPFLSEKAKLIRIADKGCNIQDIVHYPLDWDLERKMQYIDFAKLIVDKIIGCNPALEAWFEKVYSTAKTDLLQKEDI